MDQSLFSLKSYDYDLPEHLIARYPTMHRDQSKLLVSVDEAPFEHSQFSKLADYFQSGDLIVFNDTQVVKSRLFGTKETGGRVEVFVISTQQSQGIAFIRASKAPKPGSTITVGDKNIQVLDQRADGTYNVQYDHWLDLFNEYGNLPLPPYMDRDATEQDDARYQTLWASKPGAVAAPTASLHFSESLLEDLTARGVQQAKITLHVGAGTFAPVRVDDIRQHQMHSEYYEVSHDVVDLVQATKARGNKVIAVGTTVLRTLETLAQSPQGLKAGQGDTSIFIYPGFEFKVIDRLVTNFHLPQSTLMMLVSAFAGIKTIQDLYQEAISQEYRFFSYGDGMLLSRQSTNI